MLSMTEPVVLTRGYHNTRADGLCIMELVALVSGEPHTDSPLCTHPIIAKVARDFNDFDGRALSDELRTQTLLPLVPLLPACHDTILTAVVPLALADYISDQVLAATSDPLTQEAALQVKENLSLIHI